MTLDNDFETYMRRVLDNGHKSRPDADAPPADTWNQVLSRVKFEVEENAEMNGKALTVEASRTPGVDLRVPPANAANPRGFGHYLNVAATVALVVAVAASGWFAIMQLNRPGDPEPRLAILSATPSAEASPESDSATCDVEPLRTDRVMEIVKNPARFMAEGATGEPSERAMTGSPSNAEYWEVDPDLEIVGESSTPTEEQFNEASVVANEYLNCLLHGTQGQIWTFYSPVLLQQKILAEFPVFAEEALVRERVEELSSQPAYEAEFEWQWELDINARSLSIDADPQADLVFDRDVGSLTVNPDSQLAISQQSESSYYEYVLTMGISITDSEEKQTTLTTGAGRDLIPNDPMASGQASSTISITIAKSRQGDGWMIIPWPSEVEGGWNLY